MRTLRALVAGTPLLAALMLVAPAAGGVDRCRTPRGATVIAESSRAVVTERHGTVPGPEGIGTRTVSGWSGCLRSRGRHVDIGGGVSGDGKSQSNESYGLALAGRFVAYATRSDYYNSPEYSLSVFDLRTGKRSAFVAVVPKIDLVTIADFGGWQKAQATHFADGGVFDQLTLGK